MYNTARFVSCVLITDWVSFRPILTKRKVHSILYGTTPIKLKLVFVVREKLTTISYCIYLHCKSPTLMTSATNIDAMHCETVKGVYILPLKVLFLISFDIFCDLVCFSALLTVFLFVARAFISGAFQGAYIYTPEVSCVNSPFLDRK